MQTYTYCFEYSDLEYEINYQIEGDTVNILSAYMKTEGDDWRVEWREVDDAKLKEFREDNYLRQDIFDEWYNEHRPDEIADDDGADSRKADR